MSAACGAADSAAAGTNPGAMADPILRPRPVPAGKGRADPLAELRYLVTDGGQGGAAGKVVVVLDELDQLLSGSNGQVCPSRCQCDAPHVALLAHVVAVATSPTAESAGTSECGALWVLRRRTRLSMPSFGVVQRQAPQTFALFACFRCSTTCWRCRTCRARGCSSLGLPTPSTSQSGPCPGCQRRCVRHIGAHATAAAPYACVPKHAELIEVGWPSKNCPGIHAHVTPFRERCRLPA